MKHVRAPQEIRNAVFVATCPSTEAIAWLRGRAVNHPTVFGSIGTLKEDHLPEYLLFRRGDPAIDVTLAEHGRSRTVLRRLYDRACPNLRAVLCSNPSLFIGEDYDQDASDRKLRHSHLFAEIIRSGSPEELRALCANPGLDSGFYNALIGLWPGEDGKNAVEEGRFRSIVEFLSYNPRVSTPRSESRERHYHDGFAEHEYDKFYVTAWNLATKVPATPEWAGTLSQLFHRLHKPYQCLKDVPSVLERWTPNTDEEGYGPYRQLRETICKAFIKPTLSELRHPDAARRSAFIETFDPSLPEFQALDWRELAKADPHWDLRARDNMKIWASASGRRKFREQLWEDSNNDHDITPIGFFDEREEQLRQSHPEWFAEPEHEEENTSPPAPDRVDLLRAEIRSLTQTMTTNRNRLLTGGGIFIVGLLAGHWLL